MKTKWDDRRIMKEIEHYIKIRNNLHCYYFENTISRVGQKISFKNITNIF